MKILISKLSQRLIVMGTLCGGITPSALAEKLGETVSYETWIASRGLEDADSKSTADPDNDGVSNALEFLLGGEPNPAKFSSNSAELLRTCSIEKGHLICSFKRKKVAKDAISLVFEWAPDLKFNQPKSVTVGAVSETLGEVVITVVNDPRDPKSEAVSLKVPLAGVVGDKLFGRLRGVIKVPAEVAEVSGYLDPRAAEIQAPYNAGFSMYSAVWPIVDTHPGVAFQTGLFGTWMHPKQVNPVPPGEMYTDIEGGLGWWRDTQFPTLTPKFIMGGVAINFAGIANGPSHGSERNGGLTGVAQISPWLLFPIDGLNLKQGQNGELLGYGYHPMPLISAKKMTADPSLRTGENCWTLFLNTTNFKGPVCFFTPYFWSRATQPTPEFSEFGLDKLGADPHKAYSMETQHIPAAIATGGDGNAYSRTTLISFPLNSDKESVLMHRVMNYTRSALFDGVKAWFEGTGPAVTGRFAKEGSFPIEFLPDCGSSWGIKTSEKEGGKMVEFNWKSFATTVISPDRLSFGFKWDNSLTTTIAKNVVLPQYFRLATTSGEKKWEPVAAAEAPETLREIKFTTPPRPAPEGYKMAASWILKSANNPGPVAGPFTAKLGDKSIVTYYWYRFADQPALLDADLTAAEREAMQLKVVKLHLAWTKDREYLAPPTVGTLATLDPAQIVMPPKGFEVGYIPIAIRQELAPETR